MRESVPPFMQPLIPNVKSIAPSCRLKWREKMLEQRGQTIKSFCGIAIHRDLAGLKEQKMQLSLSPPDGPP